MYSFLEIHRQQQDEARRKAGEQWKEMDLVFCNAHGSFLNSNVTRIAFYKLLDQANKTPDESGKLLNIPPIHIHDLRHTASTLWQSMGISEKVVQELLGHSTLEMTRIVYTHVIPSMQKDAAEKINSLLQGGF
jgi:integrase